MFTTFSGEKEMFHPRRNVVLSLMVLNILGVFLTSSILSALAADWPMFHLDPEHTGAVAEEVTPPLALLWSTWLSSSADPGEISPAVSEGIVCIGGSYDSRIYALNATTGAKMWNYTAGDWVKSSPAIVGGVVYVGTNDDIVYALNATTGVQIWNYTVGSNPFWTSPAVSSGIVYIAGLDKVYALNATTGTEIWNYTASDYVFSSPAVSGGVVYVGSDDDKVYALDATSGVHIWNYTTGGDVESSPAVSGGVVYVGSDDKKLYALNATTGVQVWNYTIPTASSFDFMSSPAVYGDVVYVGGYIALYAVNVTTGTKIWSYTTGGLVYSSPAVSGGIVYVGSDDDKVYALNATSGVHIWNYTTGGDVESSPAVSDGVVYIGSRDRKVYAFVPGYEVTVRTDGLPSSLYKTHVYIDSVDQGTPYLWDGNSREFTLVEGQTFNMSVDEYVANGAGIRYHCEAYNWTTASSGTQEHNFTYVTQYNLTVATSPAGLSPPPVVDPPDLWYDEGTSVDCTAQDVTGYVFSHWTANDVDQGSGVNPITVVMNEPYTVVAHYVPFFTIDINPSVVEITQGDSETLEVTVNLVGGSSGVVTLSASGQPAGVSVSFDPSSGTPTFTSTMTITTDSTAEPGTYTITVTGTGSPTYSKTFRLTMIEYHEPVGGIIAPTIFDFLAPLIGFVAAVGVVTAIALAFRRRK